MFNKNDKLLFTARKIINISTVVMGLLLVICGIVLCALVSGWYILISLFGGIGCWLVWVFARLYLTYLCDIKLIRNKLYSAGIDEFYTFTGSGTPFEKTEEGFEAGYYDKAEHLKQLKLLLDNGVLTQEEYEAKRLQVLNDNSNDEN